jgi:hypothetical protein
MVLQKKTGHKSCVVYQKHLSLKLHQICATAQEHFASFRFLFFIDTIVRFSLIHCSSAFGVYSAGSLFVFKKH